ncbi:MAG: IS1182 family transposase [Imperialibacter sp.]|uniref:IS1182 family transposase n=1 Tax=Imperialibacter sp. TaxID=2038411 RepID=UPI0032EFC3D1
MTNTTEKVVFKDYNSNQLMLLPPSLEELIAANHPVRIVQQVIERIDIQPILKKYKGGGTSSYHPKMLLKILVYGYLSNIYSSRKLEAATGENIHFMWLSGMSRPDHNTINRFRSDRLKDVLKEVFSQVVMLLVESGHVDLKDVYTDGTKIEANANKYTFVWGRAIKSSKEKISRQLEELWAYTQQVAKDELGQDVPDFTQVEPEQVAQTIERINNALEDRKQSGSAVDKKVKQKVGYARRNWPGKLAEYAQKEQILGERNSYSKTDTDATFMRMKEDHMGNGQLKAGYNLQISTQKQFILHYTLHQKPTDTTTLIPHFEQFRDLYQQLPENITADAGYGSEENYQYLDTHKVKGFVKYNYFHKEQKQLKKETSNQKITNNLHYDTQKDRYICPMGQPMERIGTRHRTTENGHVQQYARYKAKSCSGCPLAGSCKKPQGDKILEVNHQLNTYKQRARELLLSEEGIKKRKNRPADVEAVFGQLKHNRNFKRFNLRGLPKVEIEMGLLALAHNLAKIAA